MKKQSGKRTFVFGIVPAPDKLGRRTILFVKNHSPLWRLPGGLASVKDKDPRETLLNRLTVELGGDLVFVPRKEIYKEETEDTIFIAWEMRPVSLSEYLAYVKPGGRVSRARAFTLDRVIQDCKEEKILGAHARAVLRFLESKNIDIGKEMEQVGRTLWSGMGE